MVRRDAFAGLNVPSMRTSAVPVAWTSNAPAIGQTTSAFTSGGTQRDVLSQGLGWSFQVRRTVSLEMPSPVSSSKGCGQAVPDFIPNGPVLPDRASRPFPIPPF